MTQNCWIYLKNLIGCPQLALESAGGCSTLVVRVSMKLL